MEAFGTLFNILTCLEIKIARIIFIHKDGKRNSLSIYKPILTFSTFKKIFEKKNLYRFNTPLKITTFSLPFNLVLQKIIQKKYTKN